MTESLRRRPTSRKEPRHIRGGARETILYFTETARVENQSATIKPLPSRNRPARVAVLAVTSRLQKSLPPTSGPLQKLQTAGQTHGGSQRKPVPGCDVGQPYSPAWEADALLFPHRPPEQSKCSRRMPETPGPRQGIRGSQRTVLNAHSISGIQQQPGSQIESLLHSSRSSVLGASGRNVFRQFATIETRRARSDRSGMSAVQP